MAKTTLTIQVFGTPKIEKDHEPIFFSFAKINALIYYLLINEVASRDEVAGLLWPTKSEVIAKKNLRNTVYQANKLLGDDYIISPNKAILMLNPNLAIVSDVAQFMADPERGLKHYHGDFLKGFYMKDCEQFELWMMKLRSFYEQTYISAYHRVIVRDLASQQTAHIESAIRELMAVDEFNERNYQLLMALYLKEEQRGKAIETYYELANVLEEELGIEPSEESKQLYDQAVKQDVAPATYQPTFIRNTTHFWGRVDEIRALESYLGGVFRGEPFTACILTGDTGVGKRTVTRQVLANVQQKAHIILSECLAEEREQPLRVWRQIVDQLTRLVKRHQIMPLAQWQSALAQYFPMLSSGESLELPYNQQQSALSQIVIEVLQQVASQYPIVILIEDAHWLDEASIQLLQSICSHIGNDRIGIIVTKQLVTPPALAQLISVLTQRERLTQVQLLPFSKVETYQLIDRLVNQPVSEDVKQQMYLESEGSAHLLAEYCGLLNDGKEMTPLTPAIRAKMMGYFSHLTSIEQDIVKVLACCPQAMAINVLSKVLAIPYEQVVRHVANLVDRHWLIEDAVYGEPSVAFAKRVFKHFCYDLHPLVKRRLLHAQIALQLEQMRYRDSYRAPVLQEIAYHYTQAKEELKALDFELRYLQHDLQIQHELFPIYNSEAQRAQTYEYRDEQHVQAQLARLKSVVAQYELDFGDQLDYQQCKMKFLYLEGRHYIRTGRYDRGISNIQQVIAIAKELKQLDMLHEAYRQLIYYCIQVEHVGEMQHYIELALETAVQDNNHQAIGVLLRLKGLHSLMSGNLDEAERFMTESVAAFRITPALEHQFAVNIAAAYDYLGEVSQLRGNFSEALRYQQQAIQLCTDMQADTSLRVFYVGLGISYFLMGQYDDARDTLEQARVLYLRNHFQWKKPLLDGFLALLDYREGALDKVLAFLEQRDDNLRQYGAPRDRGFVYYVLAMLKKDVDAGRLRDARMMKQLNQTFDYYASEARTHLNRYRDAHLLRWLAALE